MVDKQTLTEKMCSILRCIPRPCLGYRAEGSNISSEIRRLSRDQWSGCWELQLCQVSDALMFCATANMYTTFTIQEVTECLTEMWPLKIDIILQFTFLHTNCNSVYMNYFSANIIIQKYAKMNVIYQ